MNEARPINEAQLVGEFRYWRMALASLRQEYAMTPRSRERVEFEIMDCSATACEILHERGALDARMAGAVDEAMRELGLMGER